MVLGLASPASAGEQKGPVVTCPGSLVAQVDHGVGGADSWIEFGIQGTNPVRPSFVRWTGPMTAGTKVHTAPFSGTGYAHVQYSGIAISNRQTHCHAAP